MTKVQAKELEDKFILAVLQLIFYAKIIKKCFSFAPPSEAELAVWCFGERKNNNAEKVWANPSPNPAVKGQHRVCTALQGRADRAQDGLVPKKWNKMQASSDTDLETALLFFSLVGHRIWSLPKEKKNTPLQIPAHIYNSSREWESKIRHCREKEQEDRPGEDWKHSRMVYQLQKSSKLHQELCRDMTHRGWAGAGKPSPGTGSIWSGSQPCQAAASLCPAPSSCWKVRIDPSIYHWEHR